MTSRLQPSYRVTSSLMRILLTSQTFKPFHTFSFPDWSASALSAAARAEAHICLRAPRWHLGQFAEKVNRFVNAIRHLSLNRATAGDKILKPKLIFSIFLFLILSPKCFVYKCHPFGNRCTSATTFKTTNYESIFFLLCPFVKISYLNRKIT